MDAIKLLETQHREVEALFKKAEKASSPQRRMQLFLDIADALAIHTTIEEKIFYPSVMIPETQDILLESVEEHLAAKRLIADLLRLEASDRTFEAKMSVLKEEVLHHVQEERKTLFRLVKKHFERDELLELGEKMGDLADSLEDEEPRNEVPEQIESAAELPEA